MTPAAVTTLIILAAAALLLSWGRWRADFVALCVPLALAASGVLAVERAFSGFGSPVLITVAAIFIISAALERTGAAALLGRRLMGLSTHSDLQLAALLMTTVAVLSGFMNNLGALAVLLPVAVAVCVERGIVPSRLLLPLALSARLGGVLTLVAGPSNLIASAMLADRRGWGFGLFEFLPLGVAFVAVGILFFLIVGRRLLPDRPTEAFLRMRRTRDQSLVGVYRMHERLRECRIQAASPLVGRTVAATELGRLHGAVILGILRRDRTILNPSASETLQRGDRLLVGGVRDPALVDRLRELGLDVHEPTDVTLESFDVGLAEVVVSPRSALAGKTLRDLDFRKRYGVSVLAIWRRGQPRRSGIADIPLEVGDALLVQGLRSQLRVLAGDPDFLLLEQHLHVPPRTHRIPAALAAVAGMSVAIATGFADVAVATLGAALFVLASGCLPGEEAYRTVDWRSLVFIGGMLPLGLALADTGAAPRIGEAALALIHSPFGSFAALYAVAIALNQVVPSVAATVVLGPVALEAASRLGASPAAFMMAVVAATGTTFTPVSNPVNLLVMGPGGYTLRDYFRVGAPLAVLLYAVGLLVIPLAWPL
ncbi:MAG: SLC13 family permease [Armatimonadota bacterium]|nr:SLC13 family permease [Armatimonadota bacterium]MDR5697221.1 SLC13 family permease [Armatimonadota bacterium]